MLLQWRDHVGAGRSRWPGTGDTVGTNFEPNYGISVGDMDNDGDLDIVIGNQNGTIRLYLNDGDSAPFDSVGAGARIGTDSDSVVAIALGDMNSDGTSM